MKKLILILALLTGFAVIALPKNEKKNKENSNTENVYLEEFCKAISKGDFNLVKEILNDGLDINQKNNGITPLMYAARYNKVGIVKLLLNNGANPNIKDRNGFNAQELAVLSNANDAAKEILSYNYSKKKKR